MNRERLVFSIGILRHFINGGLGITRDNRSVTGFELSESLLDAAAYNTYVETVSNKADTLNLRIKESIPGKMTDAYLDRIKRLSERFDWKSRDFILAFDYTDEDFYGSVHGFSIHGWTGEKGVTGKFRFLTCSVVSDESPEKMPLLSIPILQGHYKSQAIVYCLDRIRDYVGSTVLILFDRGFYDKDLMYELSKNRLPYLIFVPKSRDKKEVLSPMASGEEKTIIHDFTVNKDKTRYDGQTFLSFLKQIYDPKSEKKYDWVFASNVENLPGLVNAYKKRWRIETGFRVQDEARIKCKSKDMKIRYFLFLFEQILQVQWTCFYKNEVSFKEFVIEMHKVCKDLVAHPANPYGKPRKPRSERA